MNLYFLTEDSGAGKLAYKSWIQHLFPHLTEAQAISAVEKNHYFLLAGNGYPSYLNRICAALQDIQDYGNIDHFFICVDTEELSLKEKFEEVQEVLKRSPAFENTHVILQNCCIETWFLGHSAMLNAEPRSQTLRTYRDFYDVQRERPRSNGCIRNI